MISEQNDTCVDQPHTLPPAEILQQSTVEEPAVGSESQANMGWRNDQNQSGFFSTLNQDVRYLIYQYMDLPPFGDGKDNLGFLLSCTRAHTEATDEAARLLQIRINTVQKDFKRKTTYECKISKVPKQSGLGALKEVTVELPFEHIANRKLRPDPFFALTTMHFDRVLFTFKGDTKAAFRASPYLSNGHGPWPLRTLNALFAHHFKYNLDPRDPAHIDIGRLCLAKRLVRNSVIRWIAANIHDSKSKFREGRDTVTCYSRLTRMRTKAIAVEWDIHSEEQKDNKDQVGARIVPSFKGRLPYSILPRSVGDLDDL
jgi:hypothetical protein